MEVRVVVVSRPELGTEGTVDTDVPLGQVRSDIVGDLNLGDPADWELFIGPADQQATLNSYSPGNGDSLVLVPRSSSRGSSFKRH